MTVKEFFENKENLAIHCDTEEKADKLLKLFYNGGYKWSDGKRYGDYSHWEVCGEETCYSSDGFYGDKKSYKDRSYRIIEFEEIEV